MLEVIFCEENIFVLVDVIQWVLSSDYVLMNMVVAFSLEEGWGKGWLVGGWVATGGATGLASTAVGGCNQ